MKTISIMIEGNRGFRAADAAKDRRKEMRRENRKIEGKTIKEIREDRKSEGQDWRREGKRKQDNVTQSRFYGAKRHSRGDKKRR